MRLEGLSIMKAMKKREKIFKKVIFLSFIAVFIFFFLFLQYSARSISESVVGTVRYQERIASAYKFSLVMGVILLTFYISTIVIWNIFSRIDEFAEISEYKLKEIQEVLPNKLFWGKLWSFKSNEYYFQNFTNKDLIIEYNKRTFFYVTKYLLFIDRGIKLQILDINDIKQIIQAKITNFHYIQRRNAQQVTYKFIMNSGEVILASIPSGIINFDLFSKVVKYYNPYIDMVNERV
ncbi:hypothetical protein [Fusobacterium sp. PH5-44]|uniref:hypothetical protein n=1 Tax=unclassified Fusobacterium TaxID=2648384 RepID=UPI003D1C2CBA